MWAVRQTGFFFYYAMGNITKNIWVYILSKCKLIRVYSKVDLVWKT